MIYRIKRWNAVFENNRSRELKNTHWVAMPNSHDTLGYLTLVALPNGAALYGAWCVLVQIASRCKPRGTLVQDGSRPHTARTLALKSRLPQELFEELFEVLRLPDIEWIEALTDETAAQEGAVIPQEGAVIPQEGAVIPQEGAVIPQEGAVIPQEGAGRARAGRKEDSSTEEVPPVARSTAKERSNPPPAPQGEPEGGRKAPFQGPITKEAHEIREEGKRRGLGDLISIAKLDEHWEGFQKCAQEFGIQASGPDWEAAYPAWRKLSTEQQFCACKFVTDPEVPADDYRRKALPENFLAKRMWERQNIPSDKKPSKQEETRRLFRERVAYDAELDKRLRQP